MTYGPDDHYTLNAINFSKHSPLIKQSIEINILFESMKILKHGYRQVSNIRRTLIGNKILYHSDVVGASPVGAAPTTSSFST